MRHARRWCSGFGLWTVLALAAQAQTSPPPAEPPEPAASRAVQRLLDEAEQQVRANRRPDALLTLERALAAACEGQDAAGEASAHRQRAAVLEGLGSKREAGEAWGEAAAAWGRAGDGPGQVEALLGEVLLRLGAEPEAAERLVAQALALIRAEARRPLAAAQAAHQGGRAAGRLPAPELAARLFQACLQVRERLLGASLPVAEILHDLGSVARSQGKLPAAKDYYERALAIREKLTPGSLDVARTLHNLGVVASDQGELAAAKEYYERALAIQEKLAPGSLEVVTSLNNLGSVAWKQGDLAAAKDYNCRALAIREKQAPGSLVVAASLNNLGVVARDQGDLAAAKELHQHALAIREKLAPGSLVVAGSLNNLGLVLQDQGDLAAAKEYYRRALEIQEKLAPDSLEVARTLGSLGLVAWKQGDLATAEEYHRRALAIQEKLAGPEPSMDVANSLNNLGVVAWVQGDLAAAKDYYERALAIQEKQAPGSLVVAASLNNLGVVARQQGDLAAAKEYHRRALEIQEKLAPDSLEVARTLGSLGLVAWKQGDLATAEEYHRRALAIQEKLAGPEPSMDVANSLNNLGVVAWVQGDLAAAKDYYERALAIQEKQAPGSPGVARSLGNLAGIAWAERHPRQAEALIQAAWNVVRRQGAQARGDEPRQAYESAHAFYAADLIRWQVAQGRSRQALLTLEEGRAQALRQLLAERAALAGAAAGPAWTDYRAASTARDQAGEALASAGVAEAQARQAWEQADREQAPPEQAAALLATLETARSALEQARSAYVQARLKADERWDAVLASAPRAFPQPPSLDAALQRLPAGTLLVAFSAGEAESHLFLVRAGRLPRVQAYRLPLGAPALATLCDAFAHPVANRSAAILAPGRALFQRLFPPLARTELLAARRLLIAPDGALWSVPFAALVSNPSGPPEYLGSERAITYTQSLTLFAQGRQERPRLTPGTAPRALVLGDPVFAAPDLAARSAGEVSAGEVRSGEPGERSLLYPESGPPARLPGSRKEAAAIAAFYRSRPLLGEAATEAALRARLGPADVVHLATHGYFHPFRGMSSGLLLSAPGSGGVRGSGPTPTPPDTHPPTHPDTDSDGALQAWEIMSELKLRAELVVLAGCETGKGELVRGEGLIGLTRALQYAGARSIVASQWRVADRGTATLMVAFHRHLRAGVAKDEALRRAMAEVRQDPRTAHPYYWAGFVLTGDPENPVLGGGTPAPGIRARSAGWRDSARASEPRGSGGSPRRGPPAPAAPRPAVRTGPG